MIKIKSSAIVYLPKKIERNDYFYIFIYIFLVYTLQKTSKNV